MSTHPFRQVDVFGSPGRAVSGNPLAVVLAAEGVDEETMRSFASWTNLSETTFLLPPTVPGADYRVRIFTPARALPFAGHPTLGSAAAWLAAGGVPAGEVVVQECGAGLVPVRRDGELLAFRAPELLRHEPVDAELRERVARGLRLPPEALLEVVWIVNGPSWIGVRLADAEQVLAVEPDPVPLTGLDVGLVGPHPAGGPADVEVRGLVGEGGLVEDPVTGSLNAGIAQWLIGSGRLPARYTAAQGTRLGRAGRVHVRQEDDGTWIGGAVTPVVTGTVELPRR
ncbi:PhzF family phenazine biosynthesis isomerase [Auraticoccus sp. F435]|uniref:PhzF family phenazine biosynthesis isomerase n=1 Tax=Auraticoccus cholistanensis TaxID=2656650 RepID=A0A6A9UYZ0_9ACTN|nr:PhzF family phenazine biosynthesis protein [Auraticoccus cholistanensis]MVA77132.1 PhzF family phenazine biosynthesis isomerase [Auraticoccus cholistanensis]